MLDRELYGDSNIRDKLPQESWAFPTNYITRKPNFTRHFAMDFPARVEWNTDILQGYDSILYRRIKIVCGPDALVFFEYTQSPRIRQSIAYKSNRDATSLLMIEHDPNP